MIFFVTAVVIVVAYASQFYGKYTVQARESAELAAHVTRADCRAGPGDAERSLGCQLRSDVGCNGNVVAWLVLGRLREFLVPHDQFQALR